MVMPDKEKEIDQVKAALANSIEVFIHSTPGPWTIKRGNFPIAIRESATYILSSADGTEVAKIEATEKNMQMIMTAILTFPDFIKTLQSVVKTVEKNA